MAYTPVKEAANFLSSIVFIHHRIPIFKRGHMASQQKYDIPHHLLQLGVAGRTKLWSMGSKEMWCLQLMGSPVSLLPLLC